MNANKNEMKKETGKYTPIFRSNENCFVVCTNTDISADSQLTNIE